MGILYLNPSLYTLSAIILTIAAVRTVLKRTLLANSGKLLLTFSLLILAYSLALLAVEIRPDSTHAAWLSQIPPGSLILLLSSLTLIGRLGLQSRYSSWPVLVTWLAWIALFILVLPFLALTSRLDSEILNPTLRRRLPELVLFSGWLVMSWHGLQDLRHGCRISTSNLIRKRARLWVFVWGSSIVSGILLFAYQTGWGLLTMSLGMAGSTSLLLAQDLPSPRYLFRLTARLLILLIPFVVLVWTSNQILQYLESVFRVYGRLLPTIILALIWATAGYLIYRYAPEVLDLVVPIARFDLNKALHEYSQKVSQLTSPAKLTRITIDQIAQKLDLEFGHIFEVFLDTDPTDSRIRIEDSGGVGLITSPSIRLPTQSPILDFFYANKKPIMTDQFKRFLASGIATAQEAAWFSNPPIEVFVPIHTRDEWVGLFALGAKKSGGSYTQDDFTLLNTLANQLSFALQNSRMVDTLMRVNQDFHRTHTAMDQANQQLQVAYEQLEKIDQTKSDFINVASHELRTPLTVMRGYNEMLLDDPSIKANPHQQKMVKGINSGILRMQDVVDSMLDVANIDSRSLHLQKETLAISQLLEEVAERYQPALVERNIRLQVDNLKDLPPLQADKAGLLKVFTHLLSNAIKYTPDGGLITVCGSFQPAEGDSLEEDEIEIVFQDSGIGIDHEQLQLIFGKFYQTGKVDLHSTGKTKFKGAGPGLGLAIAKGIVDAHGGKIWVESTGHDEVNFPGSQFHVILPRSSPFKPGFSPPQR